MRCPPGDGLWTLNSILYQDMGAGEVWVADEHVVQARANAGWTLAPVAEVMTEEAVENVSQETSDEPPAMPTVILEHEQAEEARDEDERHPPTSASSAEETQIADETSPPSESSPPPANRAAPAHREEVSRYQGPRHSYDPHRHGRR